MSDERERALLVADLLATHKRHHDYNRNPTGRPAKKCRPIDPPERSA